MASFIAWYGKKRCRLAECEQEFLKILERDANQARIAEAAEAVRAAHLRALKEKRQKFAPSEQRAAVLEEIERAIRRWTDLPRDEIVEGYRDPKRRRKMSSDVRRAAK